MWGRVIDVADGHAARRLSLDTILAGGPIRLDPVRQVRLGRQVGKVLGWIHSPQRPTSGPVIDCSKPSAMAFPDQSWACVEWQFDSTKNEMHLWFNGTLLADADIIGKGTRCGEQRDLGKPWTGPAFDTLTLAAAISGFDRPARDVVRRSRGQHPAPRLPQP